MFGSLEALKQTSVQLLAMFSPQQGDDDYESDDSVPSSGVESDCKRNIISAPRLRITV